MQGVGVVQTVPSPVDVVIIGGGIVGASVALHLAKSGITDVALCRAATADLRNNLACCRLGWAIVRHAKPHPTCAVHGAAQRSSMSRSKRRRDTRPSKLDLTQPSSFMHSGRQVQRIDLKKKRVLPLKFFWLLVNSCDDFRRVSHPCGLRSRSGGRRIHEVLRVPLVAVRTTLDGAEPCATA